MSLEALDVDLGVPGPKNEIKQSGKSNEYVTAKYGKLSNLEPAKNGKLCVGSKLGAKIRVERNLGAITCFKCSHPQIEGAKFLSHSLVGAKLLHKQF